MNLVNFYQAHLVLFQGTFVSLFLALSLQFSLRLGVVSFAGVGLYGIGSYTAGILVIKEGWSTFPALAAGIVLPALVAALLALLMRRLSGLYLGMATIAFDLIVGVVIINGGTLTGGPIGLFGALARPPLSMLYILLITVVVLLALTYSARGAPARRINAVRDDPELASSVGISVPRYRLAAFVVSGALGGCSGAMDLLLRTTVSPDNIGFPLIVLALTMIIVGGTRWWLGALIGAIVFTWLPDVLSFVGQWEQVVYGVIVAAAAVYMPGGVVGVVIQQWRARQQRRLLRSAEGERSSEGVAEPDESATPLSPSQGVTFP
jgi:branched-chain amino acid transport system permease protein